MADLSIKFCTQCGAPVCQRVPKGEMLERITCTRCGHIHYENPKILVACIAMYEDAILWMQRGEEPCKGGWAIPSGFMEKGETLQEAAVRELRQETNAVLDPDKLALNGIGTVTQTNEVYVVFRGVLKKPEFSVGHEAMDVGLFTEEQVPWDNIAFQGCCRRNAGDVPANERRLVFNLFRAT